MDEGRGVGCIHPVHLDQIVKKIFLDKTPGFKYAKEMQIIDGKKVKQLESRSFMKNLDIEGKNKPRILGLLRQQDKQARDTGII